MANPSVFGERRLHKRKECSFNISLDDYHNSFTGHLRNLSASGAFVETTFDARPLFGQELILTIPYRQKADNLVVKGVVIRTKENGFGIKFTKNGSR